MTGTNVVAFCPVVDPVKGIRRDILVQDRPAIRRRAQIMLAAAKHASTDYDTFGSLQMTLCSMMHNHPDDEIGINAAALAIHLFGGDHFFMVECHHREGGMHTDYNRLLVNSTDDAAKEVDKHPNNSIVQFMKMMRAMQGEN